MPLLITVLLFIDFHYNMARRSYFMPPRSQRERARAPPRRLDYLIIGVFRLERLPRSGASHIRRASLSRRLRHFATLFRLRRRHAGCFIDSVFPML